MSVLSPPEPRQDELEFLIREARARRRRRWAGVALVVASASGIALATSAALPGGRGHPRAADGGSDSASASPRHCPPGNLGTVAFSRNRALEVLDLNGCRLRTLVGARVGGQIAMSPDGRWVLFRDGYVSVSGGHRHRLPGSAVWSPRADLLAVVTGKGGLEFERAGGRVRHVLAAGWGAGTAAFSPDGRHLAVSRTAAHGHIEQIWLIDVATRARREIFSEPRRQGAPPLLEGFSPGGRWLLYLKDLDSSASILADGVPLLALPATGGRPRLVTNELFYPDYLSWCGGRLFYVIDHGGREVSMGDGLASAAPPLWRSTTVRAAGGSTSWTSLSCGGGGELAVAAGPSNNDEPFGHEHRSIWLVHGTTARRLAVTLPPVGASDEWPSWSADGRWLLFVRTHRVGVSWVGSLLAVDVPGRRLIGPIADVGSTSNYYGHYAWPSQIAWHRP